MATETLTQRAPAPPTEGPKTGIDRLLGHPAAYIATAAILLALFGWTFFTNPDRIAPTKDPAYYTWHTEMLLSDEPIELLKAEGPKAEGAGGLYAGGYRVTAPIIGGFLRNIAGIAPLSTTIFLMVGVPVLTALLLAGFAYRQRRDPLIFHSVALGAASLFLTPPFVGYLDNILVLLFLAASLHFIGPSRDSWPARIGFTLFLLLSGLTHPTTLVIFGFILGLMAAVRLVFRKFDVRSVLRDDGPMLLSALAAFLLTLAIWTIGIWGKSVSLNEAALPPPYDSDFFVDRMVLWVKAMRPALNGPLFLIGAAGLLMAGKRAAEDDLARVSIVWLVPLAGLFGFVGGLTYPYYRFFNTTLAWVLLVGLGIYFAARFFIDKASEGGASRLALLGLLALAVIVGTNFSKGFEVSGWNNAEGGWLGADERRDLDALRSALTAVDDDTPVVFVMDSEDRSPRVYGFTKLSGNTSRYGLPPGQVDQAYQYLGSLDNYLAGQPTTGENETYDNLSEASLVDAEEGIEASDKPPVVVVAQAFNVDGANAEIAAGDTDLTEQSSDTAIMVVEDATVHWWVDGAEIPPNRPDTGDTSDPGVAHVLRVLLGLALLLLPGLLAIRWFLPDSELPERLGMVPVLSGAILSLVGLLLLAITRSPFSSSSAIVALVIAAAVALVAGLRSGFKLGGSGRAASA